MDNEQSDRGEALDPGRLWPPNNRAQELSWSFCTAEHARLPRNANFMANNVVHRGPMPLAPHARARCISVLFAGSVRR